MWEDSNLGPFLIIHVESGVGKFVMVEIEERRKEMCVGQARAGLIIQARATASNLHHQITFGGLNNAHTQRR